MSTLRDLFRLLSRRERRQVLLLVPLLAFTALMEVIGIASVTPFLAIVADPSSIERHRLLGRLFVLGGFADATQFLIAIGAVMFVLIVGSNALTALSTWAVLRFSWMRSHTIGLRLLRGYLAKPYLFYLEHHSADLAKNLVAEVHQVVSGLLVPIMRAAAKAVAALAILGLLLAIDPALAMLTAAVLGGSYSLIFVAIRRQQRRLGQQRLNANRRRFETLAETFGGIKEVKLLGREQDVVRRFSGPSHAYAAATANNAVAGQIPRYAFEAIAFGGIVLIVLYLLRSGQELRAILPILGVYVFAGYRLMPSLQQIFLAMTNLRFNAAALEHLLVDLPQGHPVAAAPPAGPPLRLESSIRLRGVTFRYPTASEPLFRNLDLEIPAGSSTAIVGTTGSGKSSLADLVLGLLQPDEGVVEIDGTPLDASTRRRWQRNLGYVPQSIFLTDDTIARNIAFGVPDEEVDLAAVESAARTACIDRFILGLSDGYSTMVGERGVRLSGGQRQRIGIARALYRDPQVIVFDEATSSLDNETEERVLAAVNELVGSRTIIMIAHRLSTVRVCDRILLLSAGRIEDSGRYEDLYRSSRSFRALAASAGKP